MKSPHKIPSLPTDEPIRKLILALVGCAPLGSLGQLLIEQVWSDPSYRLLCDFIEQLSEDVRRLEQAGQIDLEEIFTRPDTRPLLSRAIEAAQRSVGEQKLQALRTATVQGIFERKYPFDLSAMVFSLLDRVTEGHIQMLQFVHAQQRRGAGGAQLGDLLRIGVDYNSDGSGFSRPAIELGRYYDEQATLINAVIMDDLLNMGLIAIDHTSYALPNDYSTAQNGPRVLSAKGILFYELIFPESGRG